MSDEPSRALASLACSKVQAWLRSTHTQGNSPAAGIGRLKGEPVTQGIGSVAVPSSNKPSPVPSLCDLSRSCEQSSLLLDSVDARHASVPHSKLRRASMSSPHFIDDDSVSLEDSPRCSKHPEHIPRCSMRNMINSIQRAHAGWCPAAAQYLQHPRCPEMASITPSSAPTNACACDPAGLPLPGAGPLAHSSAVRQRVTKFFLPALAASAASTATPPELADPSEPHLTSPAPPRLATALHFRRNSITSNTTGFNDSANELDISSTTGSTTMVLSSPRSVLGNAVDPPQWDTRPYHGAPKPSWDDERVAAVRMLRLPDTREARFDRITVLVAEVRSLPAPSSRTHVPALVHRWCMTCSPPC